MSRFPDVNSHQMVKVVGELGFSFVRQSGKR